jgi:hypothetical protein
MVRLNFEALLKEDAALSWEFLDDEPDPCAVVTGRMELLYINQPCQSLVPHEWFARRCFEILPTSEALCAMDCPTIAAVQSSDQIVYADECLQSESGSPINLGTAVIPVDRSLEDSARAILLFRLRDGDAEPATFTARLLDDAHNLASRAQDAIR